MAPGMTKWKATGRRKRRSVLYLFYEDVKKVSQNDTLTKSSSYSLLSESLAGNQTQQYLDLLLSGDIIDHIVQSKFMKGNPELFCYA